MAGYKNREWERDREIALNSLWIPSPAETFTETLVAFKPQDLQRCALHQIVGFAIDYKWTNVTQLCSSSRLKATAVSIKVLFADDRRRLVIFFFLNIFVIISKKPFFQLMRKNPITSQEAFFKFASCDVLRFGCTNWKSCLFEIITFM